MSKYVQCETEIMNEKALIKALEEMGYKREILRFGKNMRLEGYQGDKRAETADIIIPRKHVRSAANDIGFKKQADGTFKVIVSQYDLGQDKNFVQKVSDLSGVHNVIMTAEEEGWTCKRIKNAQGETVLEMERWT